VQKPAYTKRQTDAKVNAWRGAQCAAAQECVPGHGVPSDDRRVGHIVWHHERSLLAFDERLSKRHH